MKSRMMLSMLVIALVAAVIGGATMAWFTSQDTAGGPAVFTAGTLVVDVSKGLQTFQDLLPDASKHGNMTPGDVYDEIEIIIENTGTKNLAWFGNWEATLLDGEKNDKLLDGIYIHMMKMEFKSPQGADWEPMDQFITNGVGSGLYLDWYDFLAAQLPFPVVQLRHWLDNNGMGVAPPYEHMGALKPGYKYKLTVQFGFYKGTDNDYQGDKASPVQLSFTVDATQVNVDALNDFKENFGNWHYNWLVAQLNKQAMP